MSSLLEIEDLHKSFGRRIALDGVSLSLRHGEQLALLGPNGAGKTSLIRCLSGRNRIDRGLIRLNGRPIQEPTVRESLGWTPQEIAIYPDLTARENLAVFGKFCGLRRKRLRERIDWALDWTGLVDRSEELVGGFSSGMKRRVNLACGVMHSPELLLLDEPTVGVDPQSREKIFIMLDHLHRDGTSTGREKTNPTVTMYAAGIAVMFLLFNATSGGGSLLEEKENETLDRLLSTQLTMDQLLLGKWFYMTLVGVTQVTIMFIWGQLVFDVDLLNHFDGFLMMTLVTASAASSFGLCLATLCKTRGQLNGLSVILVLTMSALGGSMVPRYLMSVELQKFGLWTFNAWALDGYNKVFWRELPVSALAPQLVVLLTVGMGFLISARALAIRWEST